MAMSESASEDFTANSHRLGFIDLIRGISIILVILRHIDIRIPFAQTPLGRYFPQEIIEMLFKSGGHGVRIFFVVSGFLITTTSLKRWGDLEQIRAIDFYKIRFARIMPCLLLLLLVLSALHLLNVSNFVISPEVTSLPKALFSALTFHVNWLESQNGYLPGNWDILWTLSVEEVFYLFFPLACLALKKRWQLVSLFSILVFIGPFSRTILTENEMWASKSYLSGIDGIALGCLSAFLVSRYKLTDLVLRIFFFCGMGLCTLVLFFKEKMANLGITQMGLNPTLLAIGTSLVIVACAQNAFLQRWAAIAPFRILRTFGISSYEIYLTHMFIVFGGIGLHEKWEVSPKGSLATYFAILFAAGMLGDFLRRFFSEPMNDLLRKKLL